MEPEAFWVGDAPWDAAQDRLAHTRGRGGAIVGELFLGLPLFPGETEYNQVARIVQMRGVPPAAMLETAPLAARFFERTPSPAAADAATNGAAAHEGAWRLRSRPRLEARRR